MASSSEQRRRYTPEFCRGLLYLYLLEGNSSFVSDLSEMTNSPLQTVSDHLNTLRKDGLVELEFVKSPRWRAKYSLKSSAFPILFGLLEEAASQGKFDDMKEFGIYLPHIRSRIDALSVRKLR